MKKYLYRNQQLEKYQITPSGSVYRRDRPGGALRRVTGGEETAVRKALAEGSK